MFPTQQPTVAQRRTRSARQRSQQRVRQRVRQRGFTMAELLTVIAVIMILASTAAPSFIRLMRDRRVNAAAIEVADMYRVARTRAMGRGAAVMVRWNQSALPPSSTAPDGHFSMREATLDTSGGPALPTSSCFAADWSDGSPTSRRVRGFDERQPQYSPAVASFHEADGTPRSYAELCFTPRGRSFIRFDATGTFVPLLGVPRLEVLNFATKLRRKVLLPPTGIARVITTL